MTPLPAQLTLDLPLADADAIGATELVPERCPACRSNPAPLRRLTTKVWRCRFCNVIAQRRDDGTLAAVSPKGGARQGH